MNRRDFIKSTAALAAAPSVAGCVSGVSGEKRRILFGVCCPPKDAKLLASVGYDFFEYAVAPALGPDKCWPGGAVNLGDEQPWAAAYETKDRRYENCDYGLSYCCWGGGVMPFLVSDKEFLDREKDGGARLMLARKILTDFCARREITVCGGLEDSCVPYGSVIGWYDEVLCCRSKCCLENCGREWRSCRIDGWLTYNDECSLEVEKER